MLRFFVVTTTTCALAFVLGQIFKSFFPRASHSYPLAAFQPSPDISISSVPLPSPTPLPSFPESLNGWEVYFANNSYVLTVEQKDWLVRLAMALKQCGALELVLTGSASSAKYQSNNGERNLSLANARAAVVGEVLASQLSQQVVKTSSWVNFPELETKRLYRDSRDNDKTENPVEFLNRRVDIVLSRASDCPFLPPTTSLPGSGVSAPPTAPQPLQATSAEKMLVHD